MFLVGFVPNLPAGARRSNRLSYQCDNRSTAARFKVMTDKRRAGIPAIGRLGQDSNPLILTSQDFTDNPNSTARRKWRSRWESNPRFPDVSGRSIAVELREYPRISGHPPDSWTRVVCGSDICRSAESDGQGTRSNGGTPCREWTSQVLLNGCPKRHCSLSRTAVNPDRQGFCRGRYALLIWWRITNQLRPIGKEMVRATGFAPARSASQAEMLTVTSRP